MTVFATPRLVTRCMGSQLDWDRAARLAAGAHQSCPVQTVPGAEPPRTEGETGYCTTPGGKLIHYPNAYKWPKVYWPSTIRVVVGAGWVPASW